MEYTSETRQNKKKIAKKEKEREREKKRKKKAGHNLL